MATKHTILVVKISDGNVQRVTRKHVTTALSVARLAGSYIQIWMTRETARALGLGQDAIDTNNVYLKSEHVIQTA